VAQHYGTRCQ